MSKNPSRTIVRAGYLLATEPFISSQETRYYLRGIFIEPHQARGACIVATDGHTMSVIHDAEAIVQGDAQIWAMSWKKTLKAPIDAYIKAVQRGSIMPPGNIYADLSAEWMGGRMEVRLVHAESAADVFNGLGVEIFKKVPTPAEKIAGECVAVDGTFPEWRRVVPYDARAKAEADAAKAAEQQAEASDEPVEPVEKKRDPGEGYCPAWFQGRYVAKLAAFGEAIIAEANEGRRREITAPMAIFSTAYDAPAVVRFMRPEGFVVIMPMRVEDLGDAAGGGLPSWFHEPAPEPIEFPEEVDLKVAA